MVGVIAENKLDKDVVVEKISKIKKTTDKDSVKKSKKSVDSIKKEKKSKSSSKSDSKEKKSKSSSKNDSKVEKSEKKKEKSDKKRKLIDSESTESVKKSKSDENETEKTAEVSENEFAVKNFKLSKITVDALKARNVEALFPIQAKCLEPILEGNDLLGRARTGTGKTLAFTLPMVESLIKDADSGKFSRRGRNPLVLVMAPTRELAIQVAREFSSVAEPHGMKVLTIYGGTPYDQQYYAMRDGIDVVVGTPGRIIDHIDRGNLKLQDLKFLCLDEADQMLDIGFAENMDRVLECVTQQKKASGKEESRHQTLLFSATLPDWIKKAVQKYMVPEHVTVDLIGTQKLKASETVKHFSIPSRWQNRSTVIGDVLAVYGGGATGRTIIFVETKNEANELALHEKLKTFTQVIHGDIAQSQREITLKGFRSGSFNCLIATNVMARGLDIPEVDLVINSEPPSDVETYIHRSGRTGRAGRKGTCITFFKPQQEYMLGLIQRKAGLQFQRIGAPQPMDIVAARAEDTVHTITQEVDEQVLPFFDKAAHEILDHFEADGHKALSCALAVIAKTLKPLPPRSLVTANEGWVSFLFMNDVPVKHAGFFKAALTRQCPGLGWDDTQAWRMTKDMCGCVFDLVASKFKGSITDPTNFKINGNSFVSDRGVSLQIAKDLPELLDRDNDGSSGNSRGGNSYSGNRFSGGRTGGFRGSFRGGSSRGSSRGSFRGGFLGRS